MISAAAERNPVSHERFHHSLSASIFRRQVVPLLILALLPFLGAYVNSRNTKPAPQTVPSQESKIPPDALWIDARADADFAQVHVPGAVNLNEKNWDTNLAQLFEIWEPPRPIIVYCSAGCNSGEKIAAKLTDLGIEPVHVYEGGFETWKKSRSRCLAGQQV